MAFYWLQPQIEHLAGQRYVTLQDDKGGQK